VRDFCNTAQSEHCTNKALSVQTVEEPVDRESMGVSIMSVEDVKMID
jgi:hypothetical protein